MTRGFTLEPRWEAGTLVRLAAVDAPDEAAPPALVEVVAGAATLWDAPGWAGWRWIAARWFDLRRCRAWRLAALPRRAMTPLWCGFRVACRTAREAVAGR